MPWFKVDDSFESHPKVKSIPKRQRIKAVGLWTLAGSWCARQLMDGFVPGYMLDEFCASASEAEVLVAAELWSVVDKGFLFNDWDQWQPTKEKVTAERDAAKERMRVARERKRGGRSEDVRPNNSATPQDRSGEVRSTQRSVTPTRPDPTRPTDADASVASTAGAADIDDRFDEFWETYGHKVDRRGARQKWRLALKKPGVTADLLIEAAAAYVLYERNHNEGGRFIMGPARWLLNERWTDERTLRPPPSNLDKHLALVQQLAAEEDQPTIPQIGRTIQ